MGGTEYSIQEAKFIPGLRGKRLKNEYKVFKFIVDSGLYFKIQCQLLKIYNTRYI